MLLPVSRWFLQKRFESECWKSLGNYLTASQWASLGLQKIWQMQKMNPNISKVSTRVNILHRYSRHLWKWNYSLCSECGIILSVADSWSERFCKISFVLACLANSLSLAVNQFYGGKKTQKTWQRTRNVPLWFHQKGLKDFCEVSCHFKALGYPGCGDH